MVILNILGFIFMLGLVILIHEAGHFLMAKRAGILCHEFAIGMGPIVYSKKKGETLFSIRAIPIGGFVSMAGEEVNDELVKVGQTIRVQFDESDPNVITHLILNPDDPRYQDTMLVDIEAVDLKGKDDKPLRLNEFEVKRSAFYVMKDKNLQIAPYDRSFESKTLWQRFATIFAGPMMNFILALVLFMIIGFVVGQPQSDTSLIGGVSGAEYREVCLDGVETDEEYFCSPAVLADIRKGDVIVDIEGQPVSNWDEISMAMRDVIGQQNIAFTVDRDGDLVTLTVNPILGFYQAGFSSDATIHDRVIIGSVGAGSPANRAEQLIENGTEEGTLLIGDEILRIGYSEATLTDVNSWEDVVDFMRDNSAGEDMVIEVLRDGVTYQYLIGPFSERFLVGQGVPPIRAEIGIGPEYQFEFFGGIVYGFENVAATGTMIFSTLRALFAESRVGVGDLAGPVGIYSLTSQFISLGIIAFISWMAILSVNLGIINLLPIPALDGGRLVFLGYEAIARKPVNKRVENSLHFVMFTLLILLFLFITYNDILRLFSR